MYLFNTNNDNEIAINFNSIYWSCFVIISLIESIFKRHKGVDQKSTKKTAAKNSRHAPSVSCGNRVVTPHSSPPLFLYFKVQDAVGDLWPQQSAILRLTNSWREA